MNDTVEGALIERLITLTSRWNAYEDIPKSQQIECLDIGKALHGLGGMAAMQNAYRTAHGHNRAAHVVQLYWHDIGDWQA